MTPRNVIASIVVLSGSLWAAGLYVSQDRRSLDSAAVDYPLPSALLPVLSADGQDVLNPTEAVSGPFLLNVWASWCVSCRSENAHLKKLKALGIPIVGLNLRDEPESALNWLARYGSPYQVTLSDFDGAYATALGVTGAPETLLVDRDGHIRFHYQGLIDERVWNQRLRGLYQTLARPQL